MEKKTRIAIIFLVIWLAITLADGISTYIALSGGGFEEVVSVTKYLQETFGLGLGLLLHSIIFLVPFVILIWIYLRTEKIKFIKEFESFVEKFMFWAIIAVLLILITAPINNIYLMLR